MNIAIPDCADLAAEGKTPLFFAADGKCIGVIAAADVLKADSVQAVRELKAAGVHVVMLTGDNAATAAAQCRDQRCLSRDNRRRMSVLAITIWIGEACR